MMTTMDEYFKTHCKYCAAPPDWNKQIARLKADLARTEVAWTKDCMKLSQVIDERDEARKAALWLYRNATDNFADLAAESWPWLNEISQ